MACIAMTRKEQIRLSRFLKGRKMPKNFRRGTWVRLVHYLSLDIIEHDELLALLTIAPDLLVVLGIPAMGFNGKNQTG